MPSANRALGLLSLAVLLASSTWLAGTAVGPALSAKWGLDPSAAAGLTTSVQLGFIVGTVLYSVANLADVFNPRRVFAVSALAGAGFNAAFAFLAPGLGWALAFRFLTGVTLAGVYPVGMKIVATWFREGLGWRLGVMVGSLTLGTAMPYLLRAIAHDLAWQAPVAVASGAAVVGGLMVLGLRDGPHLATTAKFDLAVAVRAFRYAPFRNTAIGYFGHMWELYAVWALVGGYVGERFAGGQLAEASHFVAFAVVGVGALGCVGGGWLSRRVGERRVALWSLAASATACLVSGWVFVLSPTVVLVFVLLWGVVVVSDSPQFSALAARHAPAGYVGTALTVQNGIGFALTIPAIQLLAHLGSDIGYRWSFTFLAAGPAIGLWFFRKVPGD